MWMLGTGVHEQFFEHGVAEFILWQHAFHTDLYDTLRLAFTHLSNRKFFLTTRITRVLLVLLGVFFIAGKANFICIDDNDKVTGIYMWCVFRVMFSTEYGSHFGAEAAQYLVFGIDDEPAAGDFLLFD